MGNKETLEAAEIYATGKSGSDVFKEAHIRDFMEGAKWQQEQDNNKHSDEDMISAIQYTINNFFNGKLAGLNSEEIFEQFKNK
jgi:hypothetical protein